MKNADINKQEHILHIVFTFTVLLVTMLVFIIAGRDQAESDTLWHIKAGQWILQNGIPHADPFSWTMRGEEWFAHEWLWEAWTAWIYNYFGHTGIWLFNCFWITVFCGLLWDLLKRRCPLPRAALLYTLVIVSASICWNTRPHTMAQALFVCTIYILLRAQEKPTLLLLLPPISLVWANMHGSAPMSVLSAALYLLLTTASAKINSLNKLTDKLSNKTFRLLGAMTFISLLATLINPRGFHLWTYMFKVSGNPLFTNFIIEWRSPNFQDIAFWPLAIFALLLFVPLLIRLNEEETRVSLFEFLLMCGFFFLALQQRRQVPYFYFTAALVLANTLGTGRFTPLRLPARIRAVLFSMALSIFIFLTWLQPPTWTENETFFPEAATNYLVEHGLTDKLFNQYEYGGYLIWEGISPFIDGRADLYAFDSDVYKDYLYLATGNNGNKNTGPKPVPQRYLDKYEIRVAMIATGSRPDLFLSGSLQWDEVFRDEKTVIYKRK